MNILNTSADHVLGLQSLSLSHVLSQRFGFSSFRPHQQQVCEVAVSGEDLLLVMPTGAGKSLCYQLPGFVRPGTSIVISPLIALMEDQVAKLNSSGFKAERIHAGRSRLESRIVCENYLAGTLDFLFIAPERLAVPGFLEFLARRTPSLVAVDEAHCISQWGHDFRPEYRMLGSRLARFRPAPVMALTATATLKVQDDIMAQLSLGSAQRFVYGFRRTNIAIEVIELSPKDRAGVVREYLRDASRRPAIVYASTRKTAESLARQLNRDFPCAVYHAGLSTELRDVVQSGFLSGKIEVVVATVAFGMGIDKSNVRSVVHVALPSSLEGYYQEIGRAGRDGLPSRAILLWSYADRRTHDYFFSQNYPELSVLDKLYLALRPEPEEQSSLRLRVKMESLVFDRALEKLWIQGGLVMDANRRVSRAPIEWRRSYVQQRQHKLTQLTAMSQFAEASVCRMRALVRYFGDQADSDEACGLCDVCQPSQLGVAHLRQPSPLEQESLQSILSALRVSGAQPLGRLYRDRFEPLDRKIFERYLVALTRAGLIFLTEDHFTKEGREITYRLANLTPLGRESQNPVDLVRFVEAPKRPIRRTRRSRVLEGTARDR